MSNRIKRNVALFIILIIIFALFGGFGTIDTSLTLAPISLSHPFGCDTFGRDLLNRVALGSLISIALSAVITVISTILGLVLAFFMASKGVKSFLSWSLNNTLKSLSSIILALFLSSIFPSGFLVLIISISLSHIPNIARTAAARIAVIKEEDFILVARSEGMGALEIAIKHIFPHLKEEVLSQCLGIFSSSILTEATLSFLGAGIPIIYPSLGSIMAEGRGLILSHPRLIIIPSLVLFLITFLINRMERELEFNP